LRTSQHIFAQYIFQMLCAVVCIPRNMQYFSSLRMDLTWLKNALDIIGHFAVFKALTTL
jgi:hypothetical protein